MLGSILLWTSVSVGVLVVVAVGALFWRGSQRKAVYDRLAAERKKTIQENLPKLQRPDSGREVHAEFERERIIQVEDFLAPETLERMFRECDAARDLIEPNYVPGHKQGGTISYESIHEKLPSLLGFYHSPEVQQWASDVIGEKVTATGDHDQSSCSVLFYRNAGDHIEWHYDHNFYEGRHFTMLVSIVNRGDAEGGLSKSELEYKPLSGGEQPCPTPANSLVLFEGNQIVHRATPLGEGEERIIFSMTYCTNPQLVWYKEIARRIKDTAFYGIRTLWD